MVFPFTYSMVSLITCKVCLLTCVILLCTCMITKIACMFSLFTCMVSMFTCMVCLFTCMLPLFTCMVCLFTCMVCLFTCTVPLFTCMVPVFTCMVSLITCMVCLLTCMVFLLFCSVVWGGAGTRKWKSGEQWPPPGWHRQLPLSAWWVSLWLLSKFGVYIQFNSQGHIGTDPQHLPCWNGKGGWGVLKHTLRWQSVVSVQH